MSKVSYFEPPIDSKNPTPKGSLDFQKYLTAIENGTWEKQVKFCRDSPDEKTYKQRKKRSVPYITPAGEFTKRSIKDLTTYSGILGVDIDSSDNPDIEDLKSAVVEAAGGRFLAIHKSLSGTGVVCFGHTTQDNHKAGYQEAIDFLAAKGITVDPNNQDLSRARFVSYDPDLIRFKSDHIWGEHTALDEAGGGKLPVKRERSAKGGLRVSSAIPAEDDKSHLLRIKEASKLILKRDDLIEVMGSRDNWFKKLLCPLGTSARERPELEPLLYKLFDHFCEQLPGYDEAENLTQWQWVVANEPSTGKGISIGSFLALAPEAKIADENGDLLPEGFYQVHDQFSIERNEMTGLIEWDRLTLEDPGFNSMRMISGLSKDKLEMYIDNNHTKTYHPVLDLVKGLEGFHGTIDRYISGIEAEEDFPRYFKKWYVGMVAMGIIDNYDEPNSIMLCLLGAAGVGKTDLFRRLLPEELRDFQSSRMEALDNKDYLAKMTRYLLILDDEMFSHGPKEIEILKSHLTRKRVEMRMPYGRRDKILNRRASFCGTGNDLQILKDRRDNRRIVPIEIKKIHFDILDSIDRKMMLAEAVQLVQDGYDYRLDSGDITYLNNGVAEKFGEIRADEETIMSLFAVPEENTENYIELNQTQLITIIEKKTGQRIFSKAFAPMMENLGYEIPTKVTRKKGAKTLTGKWYKLTPHGKESEIDNILLG